MKKKICITAYDVDPNKGSESATGWNIPVELEKLGWDITVYTRKNNQKNIEELLLVNNKIKLNFKYFDLPYIFRFWKIKSFGYRVYFFLWQFFIALHLKFSKDKFDIYHSLNFHTDLIPNFLWLISDNVVWGPINHRETYKHKKKIFNILFKVKHSIQFLCWNNPLMKICIKKTKFIIPAHELVIRRLNLEKNNKNYLVINQMATTFQKYYKKKHQKDKIIFLSIGRFVEFKKFDLNINFFYQIYKNKPVNTDIEFLIIGDGVKKTQLIKLVSNLSLDGYVKFFPWQKHYNLKKFYQKSQFFINFTTETAGLVTAEAMSYGLPVFNNLGTFTADFINMPNYSYSITNQDKVIDNCIRLMQSADLYSKESKKFYDIYKNECTWEIKAKLISNIYNKL